MVLIRHIGGTWHQPEISDYLNEKELQDLVKLSPSLLPGDSPIAVVDEFNVPGIGSVDLLGVGISGEITIVECKLRANPEIRREVVGQVFAYAGGLWRMTYDNFAATFSRRAGKSLMTAVGELQDGPEDEVEFRQAVTRRLEGGEFRLIIVVDEITSELKTIVEYLNHNTLRTVQVLALELAFAREDDVELLIPNVYGEESASQPGRAPSGAQWNADTFTEQVESRTEGPVRDFVDKLLAHGGQYGHHPFFGAGAAPGMSYYYDLGGKDRPVWALYLLPTPKIALNLSSISKWSQPAAIEVLINLRKNSLLAHDLNSIEETDLIKKYPTIPIDPTLIDPATQMTFFESLDKLVQKAAPISEHAVEFDCSESHREAAQRFGQ